MLSKASPSLMDAGIVNAISRFCSAAKADEVEVTSCLIVNLLPINCCWAGLLCCEPVAFVGAPNLSAAGEHPHVCEDGGHHLVLPSEPAAVLGLGGNSVPVAISGPHFVRIFNILQVFTRNTFCKVHLI